MFIEVIWQKNRIIYPTPPLYSAGGSVRLTVNCMFWLLVRPPPHKKNHAIPGNQGPHLTQCVIRT